MTTSNHIMSAIGSHPLISTTLDASPANGVTKSSKKVYVGLLFYVIVSLCEVLWRMSPNPLFQKAGYLLYPISFIGFFSLGLFHIIREKLYLLCTKGHLARVLIYVFLLTMLFLYGLVRGNPITLIIHELILLYSFAIFLILGVDDRVCHFMMKLLTAAFWAAFTLSLLTFNIRAPSADLIPSESEEKGYGLYDRHASSIAYAFFRPFLDLGLPLFIHGWLERTNRWHYLQIGSIAGYLIINVALYKFRGPLVFSALVAMAALVMPSSITRKMKLLCLIVIVIMFASSWIYSKGGAVFKSRVKQFDESNKVVGYRLPESVYYFKQMGNEWLLGRGLGGTFYGRVSFKANDRRNIREGVHIGWISFTLMGGLPLLFIMLTFFAAGIRKNKERMRREPYYIIARFWRPIFFLNWIVNPISLGALYLPVYGLTFLLLAQFGKRPVSNGRVFGDTQGGVRVG